MWGSDGPVLNISFIQQRGSGLSFGGLMVEGRWPLLHSWAVTGWALASSSRASVSSSGSQRQEWEQAVVSETGQVPGSSRESVGGGEGESDLGLVAPPAALLCWPPRFWTFLLSSFRSTFSARRSFSSRWTLPWSASNSLSRTDFCKTNTDCANVQCCAFVMYLSYRTHFEKQRIKKVPILIIQNITSHLTEK